MSTGTRRRQVSSRMGGAIWPSYPDLAWLNRSAHEAGSDAPAERTVTPERSVRSVAASRDALRRRSERIGQTLDTLNRPRPTCGTAARL